LATNRDLRFCAQVSACALFNFKRRKIMGSTIESLWLGELCPGEIPPKKTKETDDIIQNINKNKAALKNMLNDE
jgi:hypothetical protein